MFDVLSSVIRPPSSVFCPARLPILHGLNKKNHFLTGFSLDNFLAGDVYTPPEHSGGGGCKDAHPPQTGTLFSGVGDYVLLLAGWNGLWGTLLSSYTRSVDAAVNFYVFSNTKRKSEEPVFWHKKYKFIRRRRTHFFGGTGEC